jgi:hypothetical protein
VIVLDLYPCLSVGPEMIKAAQLYLLFVLRLLCASARTASKSEAQQKEHCSLQEDFDSGGKSIHSLLLLQ